MEGWAWKKPVVALDGSILSVNYVGSDHSTSNAGYVISWLIENLKYKT